MTSGTGVTDSCHAFSETLPALGECRRRRDVGEVGDRFFGDVCPPRVQPLPPPPRSALPEKVSSAATSNVRLLRERSDNRLGSDSREVDGVDALLYAALLADEVRWQLPR